MRRRARARSRPSSGGMRLQKPRTQNRVQNAVKICFLYCDVRIQDFIYRPQGSGFYRKQILTAFCTLLCVLVFCNTKRLLYYMDGFCTTVHRIGGFIDLGALQKSKKGLVLQIVIWGVLDSCTCGYKNKGSVHHVGSCSIPDHQPAGWQGSFALVFRLQRL